LDAESIVKLELSGAEDAATEETKLEGRGMIAAWNAGTRAHAPETTFTQHYHSRFASCPP
jgi:hypothetical protein